MLEVFHVEDPLSFNSYPLNKVKTSRRHFFYGRVNLCVEGLPTANLMSGETTGRKAWQNVAIAMKERRLNWPVSKIGNGRLES